MRLIRSRVEQLADHLRGCMTRGELAEPLPNIRDWSSSLGVAHGTLESALKILKREGFIRTQPRKGIHLVRRTGSRRRLQHAPVVRWLAHGKRYQDMSPHAEIFTAIGQRLSAQGIRLSLEMCNASRLKAIHQEGPRVHEMLALPSFSREFQELFADFERNALLIGPPFPSVRLPFINVDVAGAVRHAVCMLARREFPRVTLVINEKSRQPIGDDFQRFCMESAPPIRGDVVRIPEELHAQNLAVQRLSLRIAGRHAAIVLSPIPAGLLMMTLMKRGMDVPGQTEVIAMNALPMEVRTFPLIIYYPYPLERFSKAVCRAAVHYFEQGALPSLKKLIPLHMVVPPR